MRIVITGGAGFLGVRLARALLARGKLTDPRGNKREISGVTLLDIAPAPDLADARVRSIAGDLADPAVIERALAPDTSSVFHLAAVVSGQAEADFDLGMRVNLDATRILLEACRALAHRPRVVFTSSVAVFGGELPELVPEGTAVTPQSSYGTEKAMAELLVNDYSRRGFVDGRSLRLPTISVRPGRPNAALSSFASSIIREPLNGEEVVCPVDREARVWLLSPNRAIDCLIVGHEIHADALGSDRIVSLPGLSITVGEMAAALERVAGAQVVSRIK